MKPLFVFAAAVFALGLGACQPARGDDAGFDAKVKEYLMTHPEVLRAALDNMQAKEDAADQHAHDLAAAKAKALLPTLRQALEHDPRDFAANPTGKVTVTEFYDYRCPHCISIAPKIVALIKSHPEVRVVFKEMPIFGATSEHAARAALAAQQQGKDYIGLYEAMMATHPLTDADIDTLAAAKGIDLAKMNAPANLTADAKQLDDVAKLAAKLAIDGTPGFVVGDEIIEGEDYDGLMAAITKAEKG
ncbi:MAG TPA: thioredoxin domain-containing protein [Caulobacteraceae bacterium]|jgi:protein-disulfide isomerase|nr:thioredoxin domain-containing protein [Caulobacteraceae bacterium]